MHLMENKINILELNTSLGFAGAQRVMVNFCRHINKDFFNVYVTSYGKGGEREQDLKDLNVEYIVANNSVKKILEFVKNKKIDVVHFHRSGHFVEIEYEIIKQIKEYNKKIIILETNIFSKFDKKSFLLIDCSLHISKMMINKSYIKKAGGFDFSKMKILYNPIDIKEFEKYEIAENDLVEYKNKIGIENGDFVIGKLGRPHIAKWSDLILDMMPYLIKLIPNVKFIIQAAPKSRIKKIKKSKYSRHFIFLEPTSNDKKIALFYKTIDLYVHSSKIGESFGMTLAEAGAFKKAVVVNSTPNRDNNQIELVDHMENGIIANHPQTFARAVEYLYKHPEERKKFGENGYKKVFNNYDAEKVTRILEKIFIEKLKEKKIDIDFELINFYGSIAYNPTEIEIKNYEKEYQSRLEQEFGGLNRQERLVNLLCKPKKFYIKLRDFIEHRLNI